MSTPGSAVRTAQAPPRSGESAQTPAELGFLRTVGLAVTYNCPLACAHCVVEASPRRRERIGLEDADRWIERIARYRCGHVRGIALTGGEPFGDLGYLREVVRKIASRGLLATAVTNAYWATTPVVAEQVLASLPDLRVLTFSTDVYHLRAIPLERVENAVRAARRLGRRHIVAVCTPGDGDAETADLLRRVSGFIEKADINVARIFPVGRARSLDGSFPCAHSSRPPPFACTMAHAPVVLPDGCIVACFGPIVALRSAHPLALGNAHLTSIEEIFEAAQRNAVLHALRLWGPADLVQRLVAMGSARALPVEYVADSPCCACHALLSTPSLRKALARLQDDASFRREVAFGRTYYLGEREMVDSLDLA